MARHAAFIIALMLSVSNALDAKGDDQPTYWNRSVVREQLLSSIKEQLAHLHAREVDKARLEAERSLGSVCFGGCCVGAAMVSHRTACQKAAEGGSKEAQFILAGLLASDRDERKNETEAITMYLRSAAGGLKQAQYLVGRMYDLGIGVTANPPDATKWLKMAAEQGYADAQYQLGWKFKHHPVHLDIGVEPDLLEAEKWLRRAAEQEHPSAQAALGVLYASDEWGNDFREAIKWYLKAAKQGDSNAQFNVGVFYDEGRTVVQDYAEAAKWFQAAAEQNNIKAQLKLADFFRGFRPGVSPNLEEAARWLEIAATNGNAEAQYNLGTLYAGASEPFQSNVKAYAWFNICIATASGTHETFLRENAEDFRREVAQRMSPQQIAEAQRTSREWMEANLASLE